MPVAGFRASSMEENGRFSSGTFARRSRDRPSKEEDSDRLSGTAGEKIGESRCSKQPDEASLPDSNGPLLAESACRSAQSQVCGQGRASSICKRGWFSFSARQHSERRRVSDERRRLSDVGARTDAYGESKKVPKGMYTRFDRLSCSTREPEMDCLMLNSSSSEVSRDSGRAEFQRQDTRFFNALQKHESGFLEASVDSCVTEISQKHDGAKEQGHRKSIFSKTSQREISSKIALEDRNDPFEKSGNDKHKKFFQFGKHFIPSHGTKEAPSSAGAIHRWLRKHILKKKGPRTLKIGERETVDCNRLKQRNYLNQKLWGQDQRISVDTTEFPVVDSIPEDRILYSSEGFHVMGGSAFRTNTASRVQSSDQDLIPQLYRSSSVPYLESCYMYQNISADMPRRSEASAAFMKRLPIIEFGELQTCESEEVFLPPKNHRESMHRRLSFTDNLGGSPLQDVTSNVENKSHVGLDDIEYLNNFLRRQRMKLSNMSAGNDSARVKIILSGSDMSLSSVVTAICHAWLSEHLATNKGWSSVPVINTTRQRMWEHTQVAWLFHHSGLDGRALFFCDEVDLESLVHARQLSIVVVGQDTLQTNDEVASLCTVLVEEYREYAYNLLQLPYIRDFLLAGILQDTQNLDNTAVFFTRRDKGVVDLLLLGATPNYRHHFFAQLNQEHSDNSFEGVLRYNYGDYLNNSGIVGVDDEDESLVQEVNTDNKGVMEPAKMDLTRISQLRDESRSSQATWFDSSVYPHPEDILTQSGKYITFCGWNHPVMLSGFIFSSISRFIHGVAMSPGILVFLDGPMFQKSEMPHCKTSWICFQAIFISSQKTCFHLHFW